MKRQILAIIGLVLSVSLFSTVLLPLTAHATPGVGDAGSWQTASTTLTPGNFAPGVQDFAAVQYNGYAYSLGGYDSDLPLNKVFYTKLNADGSTRSWVSTTVLPGLRAWESAAAYNGYIYVMGGQDITTNLNTVYYAKINSDGTVGSWQTTTVLPDTISGATAVAYDGYVYEIGGEGSGFSRINTVYYAKANSDGSLGSWQSTAHLPAAINASSSVVSNGYIYELGGHNGSGFTGSDYYAKINSDGSLGSWQTGVSLPQTLGAASSVTINGYVYVLGGNLTSSAGGILNTVYYAKLNADGSVGAWQTSANVLPKNLEEAAAVTYNGYIYFMDGIVDLGGGSVDLSTHVYYSQPNFPANSTAVISTAQVTTPVGTLQTCAGDVTATSLAKQDTYSYPFDLINVCYYTYSASNQITATFVTNLSPSQVKARDYNSVTQTYMDVPGATITATTYNGHAALQLTYSVADNGPLDSNTEVGIVNDPVGLALIPASTVTAPETGFGSPHPTSPWAALLMYSSIAIGLCAVGVSLRKLASNKAA